MTVVATRIVGAVPVVYMSIELAEKALPMTVASSSGESGVPVLWHNADCCLDCSDRSGPVTKQSAKLFPEMLRAPRCSAGQRGRTMV